MKSFKNQQSSKEDTDKYHSFLSKGLILSVIFIIAISLCLIIVNPKFIVAIVFIAPLAVMFYILPALFLTDIISHRLKLTNSKNSKIFTSIIYSSLLSIATLISNYDDFDTVEIIRNMILIFIVAMPIGFKSAKYLPDKF